MRNEQTSPTAVVLTLVAALGRLIPHPANMTPIGASSLFGGAVLARPWNYLLPLLAMFVTDIFLGFHSTIIYVYASIALGVFLAERLLRKSQSLKLVALISAINATTFFLITNFGVWASTQLYPKTTAGLYQCYLMGLPFFRNMIIGDLLFGVGFFAIYQYATNSSIKNIIDTWTIRSLQLAKSKIGGV